MITDKYEIAKILMDSDYIGGINGDTDVYQYCDHDGTVWEIEVDRHDDDGHELDDSEVIEHAIRIRIHGFVWTDVTDD